MSAMIAEVNLREKLLKAYIEELAKLRAITLGLSKVASEEAARRVLEGVRLPSDPVEALRGFMASLGVAAEVVRGEELVVHVRGPCPLSLFSCDQLCPLPHVAATLLSLVGGRWAVRRLGRTFVEAREGACKFVVACVPKELREL